MLWMVTFPDKDIKKPLFKKLQNEQKKITKVEEEIIEQVMEEEEECIAKVSTQDFWRGVLPQHRDLLLNLSKV